MDGIRFSADIGGTFTDIVAVTSAGRMFTKKLLSTPPDFDAAVVAGLSEALDTIGAEPGGLEHVVHATTVATNALLERKGARTGLLTTEGFRDILELRRMRFPEPYDINWNKPAPLVRRALRRELAERIGADGKPVRVPARADIERELRDLVDGEGVESLAVCFLNSYLNPDHEMLVADVGRRLYPGVRVSLSSAILPEIGEYERTSTTVVNAYVGPVVERYVTRLGAELTELGVTAPMYVFQSGGGMLPLDDARRYPVNILESGPAAGVIAAARLCRQLSITSAVAFDMGGTTAKAAFIADYEPIRSMEYEVGAPISVASRLLQGGGYLIRMPVIDVAEVGTGGGSLISIDPVGAIHVGPRSAGAVPGPVCYGRGGQAATVTDANVTLGYVNPITLAGGSFTISRQAAVSALAELARQAHIAPVDLAYGVHEIANATMARTVRAVSTELGRDLTTSSLIAFGGSGPVHAAGLARDLGIPSVIIPPSSGVFSAVGLLMGPVERNFVRTVRLPAAQSAESEFLTHMRALHADSLDRLSAEKWDVASLDLTTTADLRYRGQIGVIQVQVPVGSRDILRQLVGSFQASYQARYGLTQADSLVEVANLRLRARMPFREVALARDVAASAAAKPASRPAYFGTAEVDAPVISRGALSAGFARGPLLIDEADTTIVVPPGCAAQLLDDGSVHLRIGEERR